MNMMLHSILLWQQLQDFAGEPLMATTGGINIAARSQHGAGCAGGLADLQKLYERRGFAHELLSAAEVNARWPQFCLSDDLHALYQPDYGVLYASAPGPCTRLCSRPCTSGAATLSHHQPSWARGGHWPIADSR